MKSKNQILFKNHFHDAFETRKKTNSCEKYFDIVIEIRLRARSETLIEGLTKTKQNLYMPYSSEGRNVLSWSKRIALPVLFDRRSLKKDADCVVRHTVRTEWRALGRRNNIQGFHKQTGIMTKITWRCVKRSIWLVHGWGWNWMSRRNATLRLVATLNIYAFRVDLLRLAHHRRVDPLYGAV